MLEILNFIGNNIDQSRWNSWMSVHNQWRQLHAQSFSRNFTEIINAIVNNQYMSLKRYDIDFYKEVLIQHTLIFQHNLNLKTWNLTKFPDNTQDIHALLEPNFHNLSRTS